MALYRLVYFSRSKIPVDERFESEFTQILTTARQKNLASGLSGALLFHSHFFVQVLEGQRRAVSETFLRISRDPRHGAIELVEAGAVPERLFPTWSMAFMDDKDTLADLHLRFTACGTFSPGEMSGDSLLRYLFELVRLTMPGKVYEPIRLATAAAA